jgi:FlaA1/EpsC-like NDP-sugar epimerase
VQTIGSKPGEKLYEELMSNEETRRSIELEKYFVVLPAFKSVYQEIDYHYPHALAVQASRPYNSGSETPMTQTELKHYLLEHRILEEG